MYTLVTCGSRLGGDRPPNPCIHSHFHFVHPLSLQQETQAYAQVAKHESLVHTLNLVDADQRDCCSLLLFGVKQVASSSIVQVELVVQVRLVMMVAHHVKAVLIAVWFE